MEQDEIDAIESVELSPEDEAANDHALANARAPYDEEVALSAEYDAHNDLLIVKLRTGQRLAIPREDLQGLANAEQNLVANVTVETLGTALHWEELDVDFGVDGLRQGRYGSERWMKQLRQRRSSPAESGLARSA